MAQDDPTRRGRGQERVVASTFTLLGIGILLPWNAFVSAKPYFESRLCAPDGTEGNSDVELWFGLVFNLSGAFSLASIIITKYWGDEQKRTRLLSETRPGQPEVIGAGGSREDSLVNEQENLPSSQKNHSFWMVQFPLAIYLAVFLLTTIVVLIPAVSPSQFLVFTLVGLAFCGCSCSIAGAGILATAGAFDTNIGVTPYISGQSIGGLAIAIANLIAQAMEDPTLFWEEQCQASSRVLEEKSLSCVPYEHVDWATFIYFLLGCCVLGGCIISYAYVDRSDIAALLHQQRHSALHPAEENCTDLSLDNYSPKPSEFELHIQPDEPEKVSLAGTPQNLDIKLQRYNDECDSTQHQLQLLDLQRSAHGIIGPEENTTTSAVLRAIRGPAWTIWITFVVTLSVYPTWTSRLESVHKCRNHTRLQNDLFMPMTFVIFNTGDLAGRMLSSKIAVDTIQNLSRKLVLSSLARFLFGPLFLLCLAKGSAFHQVVIKSDIFSILLQFVFALTNGLLFSIAFAHAPSLIPSNAGVQETAATFLNFCVIFGLLCGSFYSFVYTQMGTGHF